MRRVFGTTTMATAAFAAAVALYLAFTAPSRTIALPGTSPDTLATGAYHVHSARSDGSGSVDDIAAAAAAAGLQFVIVTDHGDATRPPDPPTYRHGVLMIDAVEVSTWSGHVVALGLTVPAAYPLAGHPRDVIDDIHRLGGVAVVAHPDSPRPSLRWRGQNGTPFDGIEWLNIDSEWRDEPVWRLIATAARSLIRGPESVASLTTHPARSLQRLDAAARQRPTFGLAAIDAHARIAWRDDEPRGASGLRFPSYLTLFRTVAQSVRLAAPLSGVAADDSGRVLDAITAGRSFSIMRAFAEPAALEFTARQGGHAFEMGDRIDPTAGVVSFSAAIPEAPGARVTLVANGRQVAAGQGGVAFAGVSPGSYRVEVTLPGAPSPWLLSNPIVVASSPAPAPPAGESTPIPGGGSSAPLAPDAANWTVEHAPSSSASVAVEGDALRFSFALAPGIPRGQYSALATSVGLDAGIDQIRFVGRASRPIRLSVQVRLPGGPDGQRWRRSVYLDETPRAVRIGLQEFDPVDSDTSRRPIVAPVQSLLFVVDTLNTLPGTEGVVWMSNVELGLRQP